MLLKACILKFEYIYIYLFKIREPKIVKASIVETYNYKKRQRIKEE